MYTEMNFNCPNVLTRFQEKLIGVNLTICPNGKQVIAYRYKTQAADAHVVLTKTVRGTWLAEASISSSIPNASRLAEYVVYGNALEKKSHLFGYNYICQDEVKEEQLLEVLERYFEKF